MTAQVTTMPNIDFLLDTGNRFGLCRGFRLGGMGPAGSGMMALTPG